jgi:hypothetical protein
VTTSVILSVLNRASGIEIVSIGGFGAHRLPENSRGVGVKTSTVKRLLRDRDNDRYTGDTFGRKRRALARIRVFVGVGRSYSAAGRAVGKRAVKMASSFKGNII